MNRRYRLPSPSTAPSQRLLQRWRRFLLESWPGWILLAAVALTALSAVGLPLGWVGMLARGAVWLFALFGVFWLVRAVLHRFLWRIRTKLIVSYLFIAVVPIALLTLFFFLADVVLVMLVGGHLLTAEIKRVGLELQSIAQQTIEGLPSEGPPAALASALERAQQIHPQAAYTLTRRGSVVAVSGQAPHALPPWWKGPGYWGVVEGEKTSLLRAAWARGNSFLVFDVPLDARLLQEFEKRTTIHLRMASKLKRAGRPAVKIEVGSSETETENDSFESDSVGNYAAFLDGTSWDTGESDVDILSFGLHPLELVRRLSPGTFNLGDRLIQLLTVMGVVFLVVYTVALVVGLLLARSITKSVHALSVGTEKLRQGDFSTPIPVHGRDQLGDLAESFNMMAQGIQDLLREQAEKQRLEEELRIARQIQMSLLPPQGISGPPGIRIAALCLPATEVGGDYYDVLPLSPTRMGVLVADVSGKGTSAALYMAEMKGLVLSLSRTCESPSKLLKEANRILAATLDSRTFITMTYAVVDTATRTMRYARAGHNPILHFDSASGRTRMLTPGGLGLGIDAGERFDATLEEAEVNLVTGDIFVFFTDGLSEAMNVRAELFGEQRLREVVETREAHGGDETVLKERILAAVRQFVGQAAQADDLTMVILKVV